MSRSSRASRAPSERGIDTNPTASRTGSIALEGEKRLIGSGDEPDALKDNKLLRTTKQQTGTTISASFATEDGIMEERKIEDE